VGGQEGKRGQRRKEAKEAKEAKAESRIQARSTQVKTPRKVRGACYAGSESDDEHDTSASATAFDWYVANRGVDETPHVTSVYIGTRFFKKTPLIWLSDENRSKLELFFDPRLYACDTTQKHHAR
jgi:hypothetical protein